MLIIKFAKTKKGGTKNKRKKQLHTYNKLMKKFRAKVVRSDTHKQQQYFLAGNYAFFMNYTNLIHIFFVH